MNLQTCDAKSRSMSQREKARSGYKSGRNFGCHELRKDAVSTRDTGGQEVNEGSCVISYEEIF